MGKLEILIVAVLSLIEDVSFCYVILKMKMRCEKTDRGAYIGLAGACLLYVVLLMCGFDDYNDYPIMYMAMSIVSFFLIMSLYSVSLKKAVSIWLFLFAFFGFAETVVGIVLRALTPWEGLFENVILCSIAITFLLWIYHFLVGKKIDKDKFKVPARLWVMVEVLLLFFTLTASFFSFFLKSLQVQKMAAIGSVLVVLGGVGSFGLVLAVIYYFNGTEKYRIQSEMSEIYNEQQKNYFFKLLEREEETKEFRHDIIGHLMVIKKLCEKENARLKEYISDLLKDVQEISRKQYDVGNDIVNVIINYYFSLVKARCDISVKGQIDELDTISEADLCVVVSNLVKNAVEAVSCVQAGKRKICFSISEGNQYLIIRVANNYEEKIVFDKEGLPKTSKEEKSSHGYGTGNVKRMVEKYQGKLDIKAEDNWYIAEITLKI